MKLSSKLSKNKSGTIGRAMGVRYNHPSDDTMRGVMTIGLIIYLSYLFIKFYLVVT